MDIVIKRPKTTLAAVIASSLVFGCVFAKPDMYGNFPVTEKSYSGKKKDSTSYTGQVARHVLHNSLKKLAGKGNGNPNPELKATMMSYYSSKDAGRKIIDPTSKGEFKVKQTMVDEISKGKNLKGKTYKGLVNGFPGQMSGPEVFEFLIDKASSSNKGFDPVTGYNYPQLISKFMMGAVFYSQAVDNYLDEKLGADNKPNNKPYKKGAHYTGKEHSWDEAFGYFGAPAHAMDLNAKQAYGIAKRKDIKVADANGDGVVDLKTEMTFAHAYYAADSDKAGTKYMHTIVDAFIKGRQLIRDADGAALTDQQRAQLMSYAKVIKTNWERVIAEAAFKYAGSCYKDLEKLRTIVAPKVSANQNNIPPVIRVETLPSLIAGHALLNPIFIEDKRVLPELSSSFMRSNISIFASTAIPIERIVAARPASTRVTPTNLNKESNKVAYINKAKLAISPGSR